MFGVLSVLSTAKCTACIMPYGSLFVELDHILWAHSTVVRKSP
jgi:hypothetical protein